ncbi:MAG: hypothetical protein KAX65_09715, partial [Caldilineaceae bacterium]|nr:hypothetical protein [Caldilineaceae bacterium]
FSPGGCLLGSRHLRTKLFGLPLQVLDELIGFSCGLCLEFALLGVILFSVQSVALSSPGKPVYIGDTGLIAP